MHIEAVLPTRGLIYANTVVGLLDNISGDNITIITGKPMPDCFNEGIKTALSKGADYIWMVEEDNGLPRGILGKLVDKKAYIATADYNVGKQSHINRQGDDILWCGVGNTLIKREVFEKIPEPWFEVDKHLNITDQGYELVDIPTDTVGQKWGGHDAIFFYTKARPLGYKIEVIDGHYDHYRCEQVPKRELNNGQYNIYSL
jgi:hypothetical protein